VVMPPSPLLEWNSPWDKNWGHGGGSQSRWKLLKLPSLVQNMSAVIGGEKMPTFRGAWFFLDKKSPAEGVREAQALGTVFLATPS
jgi:hypothetical protein